MLYVQGVLALWDEDVNVDMVVHSHVPVGAGLSSSAALEVASLLLFVQLGSKPAPSKRETLALIAQRAEHNFAGMPCGIMDQFVVSLATPGHALKIDCR